MNRYDPDQDDARLDVMKIPELLSPAGSLKAMEHAFAYGADAVYAGQPRYSLRVRNNEFNRPEKLALGIEAAHHADRKFYVASNLSPHNDKVRTYLRDLSPVIEMKPDALIMSDPGLIMMVRETWPDMPIHLSVQANTINYAAATFWQSIGIARIILSRELSLDEIREIREECPDVELEVFVHGALCIAYSGRCLLSGYMTHRDSNQGACTNSCRWKYQAHDAEEDDQGNLTARGPEDRIMLLQEEKRPGEYLPAFEDEHGTYIMNSKDLRAVQHVERLVQTGIESLKIEGRTKSPYYVARTAQVYRRAIDAAAAGQPFDMGWMDDLEALANRGYTEGFYRRHPPREYQNYERGQSDIAGRQYVGDVGLDDDHPDRLKVIVRNRFQAGDRLELMTPAGNRVFTLSRIENLRREPVGIAPGSGHVVLIPREEAWNDDRLPGSSMLVRYLPRD